MTYSPNYELYSSTYGAYSVPTLGYYQLFDSAGERFYPKDMSVSPDTPGTNGRTASCTIHLTKEPTTRSQLVIKDPSEYTDKVCSGDDLYIYWNYIGGSSGVDGSHANWHPAHAFYGMISTMFSLFNGYSTNEATMFNFSYLTDGKTPFRYIGQIKFMPYVKDFKTNTDLYYSDGTWSPFRKIGSDTYQMTVVNGIAKEGFTNKGGFSKDNYDYHRIPVNTPESDLPEERIYTIYIKPSTSVSTYDWVTDFKSELGTLRNDPYLK